MNEPNALIRRCDGCGMTTAIDLDVTVAHKNEMQRIGQTVSEVPKSQALVMWKTAGPCRCIPKI